MLDPCGLNSLLGVGWILKKRSQLTTMICVSILTVFTLIGSVQANPLIPNVTRLSGQDRFQTSIAVALQAFTGNQLQNVIVASGYSFPDALAASPLAAKLKAPIILAGHSVLDCLLYTSPSPRDGLLSRMPEVRLSVYCRYMATGSNFSRGSPLTSGSCN